MLTYYGYRYFKCGYRKYACEIKTYELTYFNSRKKMENYINSLN